MRPARSTSAALAPGTAGVLIVLSAAVLISLTNILAPVIYQGGSNPLTYLTLRFLCFVVLCRLWFLAHGKRPALPVRRRLTGYGIGVVYAIGAGSLLSALVYIPVSLAILILFMFPLLIVVFASVLDRRMPGAIEMICFAAAFVGLALALEVSIETLNPLGLGLAGLSALAIAVAYLWNGRAMGDLDATVVTLHMSVSGLAVAAVLTFATGSFVLPLSSGPGMLALVGASLCFAGAFFAMFFGVRVIGPVRTAMVMNLEPVLTIAMSIMLLGETLSLRQFAGAALVLGAVVLAQRSGKRPGPGPVPQ